MPGRSELEFTFGQPQPDGSPRKEPGEPFRILIIADFSGRSFPSGAEAPKPLAERKPRSVSIDTIDGAMARFGPRVRVPGEEPGAEVEIDLTQRSDFDPDTLIGRASLFGKLVGIRDRLANPATSEAAAEELRQMGLASAGEETTPPPTSEDSSASKEDDSSTLARLLGKESGGDAQPAADGISKLIANIVSSEVTPPANPHQETYEQCARDALNARMLAVTHQPAFRQLEATWRSLEWLLRRVDTGPELQIFLLDATKEELVEDVTRAAADLESSSLYRVLVEQGVRTAGGQPWSLVLGDLFFGPSAEDLKLLTVLGVISSEAGGPFIGGAAPGLLGCSSLAKSSDPRDWESVAPEAADRWQKLRESPFASSIGLALPRFLYRAPYGAKSQATDTFDYEEIVDPSDHESYPWGNAVYACACSLATGVVEGGSALAASQYLDIADVDTYLYTEDGESQMKPCAEVVLTERAMATILDAGLMPLLSHANLNAIRIARLQSIADPPAALAGL